MSVPATISHRHRRSAYQPIIKPHWRGTLHSLDQKVVKCPGNEFYGRRQGSPRQTRGQVPTSRPPRRGADRNRPKGCRYPTWRKPSGSSRPSYPDDHDGFSEGEPRCRVGKGRPAGSIELRVSPSPSKIPYGGFSPVRLQMDRQWRPSTNSRGLSAVHIRPMSSSYTPSQLQFPGIRDPQRGYPFENLSVQCGTTPNNWKHVHPEALGSPPGYVVPTGHRLLRPHAPL